MYDPQTLGDFDWGALATAVGSVATAGASIYKDIAGPPAYALSPPAGVTPLAYNFGVPSGLQPPPGVTIGYQQPYYLPAVPSPSILSNPSTLTLIALGGAALILIVALSR